ncbi:MAG: hypothetical protein QXY99_01685 [Thermoproteota archaeon]
MGRTREWAVVFRCPECGKRVKTADVKGDGYSIVAKCDRCGETVVLE